MTTRERNLSLITLGAVAVGVLWLVLAKLLFLPAADARKQVNELSGKVQDLRNQVDLDPEYRTQWRDLTARSFGVDETIASDNTRAHLMKMIERAGLDPREAPLTPFTGKRIGASTQVGWVVRAKGSLAKATDLLYLLQHDPHLHRVDQISWLPIADTTDIELKARVTTLVLDALPPSPSEAGGAITGALGGLGAFGKLPDQPIPRIDPAKLAAADLKAGDRREYDLIAQRDVFKPYVKRPPPPPPPTFTQRPPTRTTDDRPPPPQPTPVKLVGLPTWDGKPAIVIKDTQSQKTTTLHVGDALLGGKIALVDYRELPHPTNPLLQSPSRVIVRIGDDYWAVEIGQTLGDKRKLAIKDLPEALKPAEAAPTTTPVVAPPAPDAPATDTPTAPTQTGDTTTGAASPAGSDSDVKSTPTEPSASTAQEASTKENRDVP